jgi:methionyl-tRNA formyltransferase
VRASVRTAIAGKTTGALTGELAQLGADLIVKVLADLPAFPPVQQPEDGITYAHKIDKAEARIDFTAGAQQVLRQILAFNPAPGAFFEAEGERYKILTAELAEGTGMPGTMLDDTLTIACGTDAIRPTLIQRAGKPAMATADLLRGRPFPAGSTL